ncbi:MAG: UDP-N-acetylglucosamine--N-acetylmuramyl-(pentapeptide) pyrophosphoryl-undecaprenol N-acetylglucosamine transferase [Vulcanococcus sp.]|jgi:UDP-N-acetylglucosamine--N-acetylmuramyl-(pentapeptide) pyrophosphoryl-undecaprenol N-acetylglucosamine transferase|uniref:UDP-N-acetylglucosamine--N-acetylmuramyl- (pentapeptide) pyrophosphoryl-undecaprenol N-acetylglucosamine transferase n=1 Tax=Vulcanococcus sp. TaxID=2856995 RepID=UPI0025FD42AD|nr:UDP-N-acetylglucosamine--N-acetylmuramyl-(pentapeptide) pyrophosphoryl-undecaprenol N-acetylglucosamine transferase [Vulcanococcus sp.]MBW0174554.1 UDP-N-acetylglucosamine--N-acetylmuramyl-(pentapeptide) pyrophosphoryl-undecaprenol N-acetylglucosamine transferase [Vulcanococcus sp.]MBW0181835.1 UDP-N-acetylglucosamine--N-acetylmuramyl-(pentapeptide) pyrophosphoryl-undecaprenol N-acetylglucosamine transferase [Vulcanococcus sp.]
MSRLLIAASGTGGHLFPALAVAQALPADWQIQWLGVPDRLETELVPAEIPLHTVNAGGLQGRGLQKLLNLLRLLGASWSVRQLIRRAGIRVVISTGGYIAAPAILGARWCGVPVVLHESNGVPGRVTRLLGRFCTHVAVGLPQAAERLKGCQPRVTGTPVRREFLQPAALPAWVPAGTGPLLVVMGGSQGAVGLNRMVRPVLPRLLTAGCRVVHLSGSNDPESGQLRHPAYAERPFSDEVAGLLQHADLVISRAGAGSLSELAVCGSPAILVPFPQAADKHQDANAGAAAALGAAVIVWQHPPEHPALEQAIWRLLGPRLRGCDPAVDPLLQLLAGMEGLAVRDADQLLAGLLMELSS